MHLLKQSKKYKGKTYNYYSIAESYRDKNGRSQKKVHYRLGKLTDEQADTFRNVLALQGHDDAFVATMEDLLFHNQWAYLDVLFLHQIWEEWSLSDIFPHTGSEVSTKLIAEILTINRCLAPGSKRKAVRWFPKTVLPWLMDVEKEKFNVSRIYRELDLVEKQKNKLEKHLIQTVPTVDSDGMQLLFYDLTASYFEGQKCALAKPGYAKAAGFQAKQIVLALLVNKNGYPLMWDILEGATTDVKTIEYLLRRCKTTLGRSDITLVFDRGMVSDNNLSAIDAALLKYISALDKDQITGIVGKELETLSRVDHHDPADMLEKLGFVKFDRLLYYRDLGVINNRRYILGLNPESMLHERKLRERLLDEVDKELTGLNNSLKAARKSRKEAPTAKKVEAILRRKNANQLIRWELKPITVEAPTIRKGIEGKREISSFEVIWSQRQQRIAEKQLLDGVCLFVSNHVEQENENFKFPASAIVAAYRDKNEIEFAFREVKSFLEFQPVYVRLDDHVRAHYTICILGYLLNITVRNRIKDSQVLENCHPCSLYSELETCRLGQLGVKGVDKSTKKLQEPNETQKTILQEFGYEHLTSKEYMADVLTPII